MVPVTSGRDRPADCLNYRYVSWLLRLARARRAAAADLLPRFWRSPWIQASEPSNNVCFRKNLYLSETPKYAWLQMAGIDGFRVSVNGKQATRGKPLNPGQRMKFLA